MSTTASLLGNDWLHCNVEFDWPENNTSGHQEYVRVAPCASLPQCFNQTDMILSANNIFMPLPLKWEPNNFGVSPFFPPDFRLSGTKVISASHCMDVDHVLKDMHDNSQRLCAVSGLRKHGAFTILPNTKISTIMTLDDLISVQSDNPERSSENQSAAQKTCADLLRPVVTSTTSWTRSPMLWSNKPPKPRRGISRRAVFSDVQRQRLEDRFQIQKYISKPDRKKLSETLGLKDSQVKVWFQNRRMKWRNSQEREMLICRSRAKDLDGATRKFSKKDEDHSPWN